MDAREIEKMWEVLKTDRKGKDEYTAGVLAGQLKHAAGCWSLLAHCELEEMGDILVPKRLRRRDYLVNLRDESADGGRCLDFHSLNYKPLFRVPFD